MALKEKNQEFRIAGRQVLVGLHSVDWGKNLVNGNPFPRHRNLFGTVRPQTTVRWHRALMALANVKMVLFYFPEIVHRYVLFSTNSSLF